MDLAKVTSKGQITIPIDIRKKLGVNSKDKLLFIKESGRIYLQNSSMYTLNLAQAAFEGEAKKAGLISNDDILSMIKELRKENMVCQ